MCTTPSATMRFTFLRRAGAASLVAVAGFSAAGAASFCFAIRYLYPFEGAGFLPAMARRGPLRVRALVCVRCPRTGRFRRWRSPR